MFDNAVTFLKNKGFTIPQEIIDNQPKISTWKSWYEGYDSDFHRYKFYNGKQMRFRNKKSMQMAKRVCEDWANMLANEKVRFTIANAAEQKALEKWVRDTDFRGKLNTMVERGMALSCCAMVVTINNLIVSEDAVVADKAKLGLTLYNADQIIPLSYEDTHVTGCAFVSSSIKDGKTYCNISVHHLKKESYLIDTYSVEMRDGMLKMETETSLTYNTGSPEPYFALFSPNVNSNQKVSVPTGQAITANAIDILQGIDTIYDDSINEYQLGRMRIFMQADLQSVDDLTGTPRPAINYDENIYYTLDQSMGQEKAQIVPFAPSLRTDSFIKGLQENLNFLSINTGLGTGFYVAKNIAGGITATAIVSGNQDLYRSTKRHERNIESVVRRILGVVASSPFSDLQLDIDGLAVVFDDSVIEDKNAEQTQDIALINAGVMSKVEYRMKWNGETKEEATAMVNEINSSTVQIV